MENLSKNAHLHLVSVAVALFIALWFQSAHKIIEDLVKVPTFDLEVNAVLGLLIFLLIISVWWWYALILTQVASSALWGHILDFFILLGCGIGVSFWYTDSHIFLYAFFVSSSLVAIRFCTASNQPQDQSLVNILRAGAYCAGAIAFLGSVSV